MPDDFDTQLQCEEYYRSEGYPAAIAEELARFDTLSVRVTAGLTEPASSDTLEIS